MTTNVRRANPPSTPPTITPVLSDGLGTAFESVDLEAGAEETTVVIRGVEIKVDAVAEGVEDAEVMDAFTLLRVVLNVLDCSTVTVGKFNKLSVIAAFPQAIYE